MKQKLLILKKYIATHKKASIITGVCILVILLAIVTGVTLHILNNEDREVDTEVGDWDNLIANLEDEPISEYDEVYKDAEESKDKPYLIKINKTQNLVTIYQKDKAGEYTVPLKSMICSVGYDTPTGIFASSDKYTWKIVNGNVWAQYATRVVGNVLIHSMPYSANDKSTLLSSYYNQMGSTLSAGCIRMTAKDSAWIMINCSRGTTIEIYESDKVEAKELPKAIKVPEDVQWDPTDPDNNNPWNQVTLTFEGMSAERTIERGAQINYMQGITVKDTCGNDITSQTKVTTDMDTFVNGTYTVKYQVEDATGKSASSTVTYHVNDTSPPQFCGLKDTLNFTSVSDVTKNNILKNVTLLDNNEQMSTSTVEVIIPTVVEGVNAITLSVSDSYGNMNTATVNAVVDANPPVINLKAGVTSVIALTQNVNRDFALSRVTAMDNNTMISADKINVSITPLSWGYTILYTVEDERGNVGSLKETVTYVEYTIVIDGETTVTDINDYQQLTKKMTVKNSLNGTASNIKVKVTPTDKGNGKYMVNYSYTYSSPLGERTASTDATVTLKGGAPVTPTAAATDGTQTSTPATDSTESTKPRETTRPD